MNNNPNITMENDAVFFAKGSIVEIGNPEVQFLKERIAGQSRQNIRLCVHKDMADPLHEMLILHSKTTYVRPHKYFEKSVSYHIIEGIADLVLFDDDGRFKDVIPMGEYGSGRRFYYRLNKGCYYAPIVRSDFFLFHEVTGGPFEASDTIYPPWAPDGSDAAAVTRFQEELTSKANTFLQSRRKNDA